MVGAADVDTIAQNSGQIRDLNDLLKDPFRPLTADEVDHFDEYMSFKNSDKSVDSVCITNAVNRAKENLDKYMGLLRG